MTRVFKELTRVFKELMRGVVDQQRSVRARSGGGFQLGQQWGIQVKTDAEEQ